MDNEYIPSELELQAAIDKLIADGEIVSFIDEDGDIIYQLVDTMPEA